jgi:hypothetical protein
MASDVYEQVIGSDVLVNQITQHLSPEPMSIGDVYPFMLNGRITGEVLEHQVVDASGIHTANI